MEIQERAAVARSKKKIKRNGEEIRRGFYISSLPPSTTTRLPVM